MRRLDGAFDVVVVGGGVAALRSAVAAAESGVSVLIVSKGRVGASGCSAQLERGIEYCVLNCGPHSAREQEELVADYLGAGMGLNRRDIVEAYVSGLPGEYERLRRQSLPVMCPDAATARLGWLGYRLHSGLVGQRGFSRSLLSSLRNEASQLGVQVLERHQVVVVASERGRAVGVKALDLARGGVRSLAAGAVVLATGGAGGVFPRTTNPSDVMGDGLALARRCGARLANLEFYTYYPLSVGRARLVYLIYPVLMSGRLVDGRGAVWEDRCEPEERPIDMLIRVREACRWIEERERAGSATDAEGASWDGRHLSEAFYREHVPVTWARLRRGGLDLGKEMLRVAPHAHQSIGGIEVDAAGHSSVPGLFAAGEVAAGLHGALRMNGSGVTAGLVMGARAGRAAAEHARAASPPLRLADDGIPSGRRPAAPARLRELRERVRAVMGPLLVVRRGEDLARATAVLQAIGDEVDSFRLEVRKPELAAIREEVRCGAEVASAMVDASLARREPLGFYLPR